MLKTLIACTDEIDDIETAVNSIKTQLDLENNLCKNSIGIIACHEESVWSGVMKAVCEAMPFDVLGAVSLAQAANEESGTFLMTLTVLTSDDVSFVTDLTPSLLIEPVKTLEDSYNKAASQEEGSPALILSFAPFMVENSGDDYVNTFTRISGGVPCFGTVAIDSSEANDHCFSIFNGQHYNDRMGMVLVYGDIKPRFFIATISPSNVMDKAALVTKSEGHILMEVNDRPVVEYFESLGLTNASETQYAMSSLPLMLDYGDGTPQISKVFVSLTPEKYALCAGKMPEGSTMYIGVFDKEDVLLTHHP